MTIIHTPVFSLGTGTGPSSLTVSAVPSSIFRTTKVESGVTTSVVVSASGGTAPYSYLWTLSDSVNLTINSPTSNSTSFSYDIPTLYDEAVGTATCTVTDAYLNTGYIIISIAVERNEIE